MEKLIELLNEWYLERYGTNPHFVKFEDYWGNDYWYFVWDDKLMVETEVWTKKYWFIKRLVDNDKIDLDGIEQRAIEFFYDESPVRWKGIRTERLIMMLSVQDNPINYLISYLK